LAITISNVGTEVHGVGVSSLNPQGVVATGDTIVLVYISVKGTETVSSISDTDGDTWVSARDDTGSAVGSAIYYAVNPTVNASKSVTVNFSGGGSADPGCCIIALAGTKTASPIDHGASATGASTSHSTTFSTNVVNSFIAYADSKDRDGTYSSPGAGQTIQQQWQQGGGTKFGGMASTEITTTAGSNNQTVTHNRADTFRTTVVEVLEAVEVVRPRRRNLRYLT